MYPPRKGVLHCVDRAHEEPACHRDNVGQYRLHTVEGDRCYVLCSCNTPDDGVWNDIRNDVGYSVVCRFRYTLDYYPHVVGYVYNERPRVTDVYKYGLHQIEDAPNGMPQPTGYVSGTTERCCYEVAYVFQESHLVTVLLSVGPV